MGKDSGIQWTHHTFNPHWGCVRVSPGCERCYAETFAHRMGLKVWGAQADRREFGDKHWRQPIGWNAIAAKLGERHRVFCASMADVFEDHPVAERSRARLWPLIAETQSLDWLLLTKRPQNIYKMLPEGHRGEGKFQNVWLGTTVEDRKRADERIPILRTLPAVVRFLSIEPQLEDLSDIDLDGIDWVIVGGESGHKAREFDPLWAAAMIGKCHASGVACFIKQMGANPVQMDLEDAHGGDWDEWPPALRVREFPAVRP